MSVSPLLTTTDNGKMKRSTLPESNNGTSKRTKIDTGLFSFAVLFDTFPLYSTNSFIQQENFVCNREREPLA